MPAAIMDCNRVPNHLRKDSAGSAPRANDFLLATLIHGFDFLE
jgi:hypothetical protein